MAEEQVIIHKDSKYRVVYERAAGVKTGDGFKVEVNGDYLDEVETQAQALYEAAQKVVITAPAIEEKKEK